MPRRLFSVVFLVADTPASHPERLSQTHRVRFDWLQLASFAWRLVLHPRSLSLPYKW